MLNRLNKWWWIHSNVFLITHHYSEDTFDWSDIEIFHNSYLGGGGEIPRSFTRRALYLMYAYDRNTARIIGLRAIKVPKESYIDSVFSRASVYKLRHEFRFEIGWSWVHPDYRGRGIATHMAKKLLRYIDKGNDNVFATTLDDNYATIKILNKCGFSKIGCAYRSIESQDNRRYDIPMGEWSANLNMDTTREIEIPSPPPKRAEMLSLYVRYSSERLRRINNNKRESGGYWI